MNQSHHHQLQATLAECLLANLSGLNDKHAKKLQKTIARATKKLVWKYAKLAAREHKGHQKAQPVAPAPAPKKAVPQATKAAPHPAPPKRSTPAAGRARRKAAPVKVAAGA